MAERYEVITEIVLEEAPTSIRHTYYAAVVRGLVPKTENGYVKVQRAVLKLRREGTLPYSTIVDNTRWMRKPRTFDSVDDALRATATVYRRALWSQSPWRLEVWCESDSIAGVIYEVTEQWDVPLMVTRGQSSETFAYNAAEAWADTPDRTPFVLYIGDLDPAGVEIEESLQTKLDEFYRDLAGKLVYTWPGIAARDGEPRLSLVVPWRRVGITIEQVQDEELGIYETGTTPKKAFEHEFAWEAEALPATYLREGLDDAIAEFVDADALAVLQAAEDSEREVLESIANASGASLTNDEEDA
jgi:hypothetical protein